MKRVLAALTTLIIVAAVMVAAQTPTTIPRNRTQSNGMPPGWAAKNVAIPTQQPTPGPPVPQPSQAQKGRLAALARQAEQKASEAQAARDRYMIELLATLGELGLKPSETTVSFNEQGEPVFGRVAAARKPENRGPGNPDQKKGNNR